jgi:DNA repair exonuclease SbcCD nuclease subunit
MTVLYNLADLHLNGYSWSRREEFYGDSFNALLSAREVIINDNIVPDRNKAVILGGDITDKKAIEDDTALAIRNFISELYKLGIKTYYINGNHDVCRKSNIGHVGVFGGIPLNKKLTKIGDFTVYGLNWVPRPILKEELERVPPCDILYLHCAFKHLLGFEGSYDLDKEDIPSNVFNVFVGDVHKTSIVKNSKGTMIVSPGPLHPCALDQIGPHGLMRITSESPREWVFMPIKTRHVLDYALNGKKDDDPVAIAEEIKAMASTKELIPHLSLLYTSTEAALADSVCSLLQGSVHVHEKKSNTGCIMTAERKFEILAGKTETSLEQEVEAFRETYPDTCTFVLSLLMAQNPLDILEDEFKKCII